MKEGCVASVSSFTLPKAYFNRGIELQGKFCIFSPFLLLSSSPLALQCSYQQMLLIVFFAALTFPNENFLNSFTAIAYSSSSLSELELSSSLTSFSL
ncbi:hypothetical protein Tco_0009926 [Tanacetum coccineum]